MLKLCDLKDSSQSVWLVAPSVTIGRAPSCNLVIADDQVDKLHAEIVVDQGVLTLRNLSEGGEILVNGVPVVGDHTLKPNDKLKVGGRDLAVLDPKAVRAKAGVSHASVAWALRANHPAIAGRVFPVKRTSVVGRSDECDITFSLSHLSRRHARLEVRDGLMFVTDLGSANGTFLNNRRVTEARVRRGDELRFDTLSFSVVGPADDLDKTTLRPAVSAPGVRQEADSRAQSAAVPADQPTRERQRFEADTMAQSGQGGFRVWAGILLVAAAAMGVYWARSNGFL